MKLLVVVVLSLVGLSHAHVSHSLLEKYQNAPTQDIMVLMKAQTKTVTDDVERRIFASTDAKATALYKELHKFTAASQGEVLSTLASFSTPLTYKGFYITNRISVRDAPLDLVQLLASREDVAEVREARVIHIDGVIKEGEKGEVGPFYEWGVGRIGSPAAWEAGFTGAGVVVSHIDTGVRYTHQDLRDGYRSDYGWFDPYMATAMPNDQNGHGSHTMGTICGRNGTGVASAAMWISCKGCDSASCTEEALISCGQWTFCPTLPDGSAEDCTKRPALSSNSWGGGNEDPFYDDVIANWNSVEITPIFAIGNSGPNCRTANSPGDRPNVISVGATDNIDNVASFSSHGPTLNTNVIKPEVSAPGSNIRSCGYNNDAWYATLSGTSMACPHVAGAVALLKQKTPAITRDQLLDALKSDPYRKPINVICTGGGVDPDDPWPNNSYGWGRIRVDTALGIAQ